MARGHSRWRWILAVAGGLVLLAAAAAGWGWWQLRGSLPVLDGDLPVAGLTAPVTITRDSLGVPTIAGTARTDVARATGFLHAQDRFFQMDILRRRGAGELSELFGAAAVELDKSARLHGFRRLAAQVIAQATPAEQSVLAAYTAGVNAGLAALPKAPWEYLVLRATPQPWREADSLLCVYAMWFDLQDYTGAFELNREALRSALGQAGLDFLAPPGNAWDAALDGSKFPPAPLPPLRFLPAAPPAAGLATAEPVGRRVVGSNAFALSGAHTATGAALLANDMHLDLNLPHIWYRAVLQWTDGTGPRRVVGVTLPGLPFMVVGSNGRVAWGFTNAYADTTDVITLATEITANSFYQTPDGWKEIEERPEEIRVKGDQPVPVHRPVDPVGSHHRRPEKRPRARPALDRARRRLHQPPFPRHGNHPHHGRGRGPGPPRQFPQREHVHRRRRRGHRLDHPRPASAPGGLRRARARRLDLRRPPLGRPPVRGGNSRGRHPAPAACPPPGPWRRKARCGAATTGPSAARRVPCSGTAATTKAPAPGRSATTLLALIATGKKAAPADLLAIQLDDRAVFLARWQKFLLEVLTDDAVAGHPARAELRAAVQAWGGHASPDAVAYRVVRNFRLHAAERALAPFIAPAQAGYAAFNWRSLPYEDALWQLVHERPERLLNPAHASWSALLLAAADDVTADVAQAGGSLARFTWGARNTLAMRHPLSRFPAPAARPPARHAGRPPGRRQRHAPRARPALRPVRAPRRFPRPRGSGSLPHARRPERPPAFSLLPRRPRRLGEGRAHALAPRPRPPHPHSHPALSQNLCNLLGYKPPGGRVPSPIENPKSKLKNSDVPPHPLPPARRARASPTCATRPPSRPLFRTLSLPDSALLLALEATRDLATETKPIVKPRSNR
jgi:penicillin amidase